MTNIDIKIEMIRKNITLTDLAKQLNVSPAAICMTRNRSIVSKRIRKAIADAIDRPFDEVFPPEAE